MERPLLLIAGPTASGKSQLGVHLARGLKGEIVSIDSVQAYRRFDIGSAKPTIDEMAGVFHHLIDIWSPDHEGDAEQFRVRAEEVLNDIGARGVQPVLVGGTNLYLKAIVYGLAPLKSGQKELRSELEALAPFAAYEELKRLDPARAASLHPNDRMRVVRALENVIGGAGSRPSELYAEHGFSKPKHSFLSVVLVWEREELRARIRRRVQKMLTGGLIQEVIQLRREFGTQLKPFETIGYKEVLASFETHCTESELESQIVAATGQFAKQQLTFWRNEPRKRGWLTLPGTGDPTTVISSTNRRRGAEIADWEVLDLSCFELVKRVEERLSLPFAANEVWYVNAKRCLDTIGY
jgi:tRNA dimethylallyltransferase